MLWEVADSWVGRTDGLSLAGRVVVVAVGFVEYLWLLLCRALIGNNVPHTGLLPPPAKPRCAFSCSAADGTVNKLANIVTPHK